MGHRTIHFSFVGEDTPSGCSELRLYNEHIRFLPRDYSSLNKGIYINFINLLRVHILPGIVEIGATGQEQPEKV